MALWCVCCLTALHTSLSRWSRQKRARGLVLRGNFPSTCLSALRRRLDENKPADWLRSSLLKAQSPSRAEPRCGRPTETRAPLRSLIYRAGAPRPGGGVSAWGADVGEMRRALRRSCFTEWTRTRSRHGLNPLHWAGYWTHCPLPPEHCPDTTTRSGWVVSFPTDTFKHGSLFRAFHGAPPASVLFKETPWVCVKQQQQQPRWSVSALPHAVSPVNRQCVVALEE